MGRNESDWSIFCDRFTGVTCCNTTLLVNKGVDLIRVPLQEELERRERKGRIKEYEGKGREDEIKPRASAARLVECTSNQVFKERDLSKSSRGVIKPSAIYNLMRVKQYS